MKKLFTLFAFLLACLVAISQPVTKFDFYLAQKQAALEQNSINGSQIIEVLVKGNIEGIKLLTDKSGGFFKYSYGNIAAIRIPLSALHAFYLVIW
jgi:hypothetical protein